MATEIAEKLSVMSVGLPKWNESWFDFAAEN